MTGDRYDPETDPDLDDDQREEALNSRPWVAFFSDTDDLDCLRSALPNAEDRYRLVEVWAFANRTASNGILSHEDAERLLGTNGPRRFQEANVLREHAEGWRLVGFLQVNVTRRRQQRRRAARSKAGRTGGKASGATRSGFAETRRGVETQSNCLDLAMEAENGSDEANEAPAPAPGPGPDVACSEMLSASAPAGTARGPTLGTITLDDLTNSRRLSDLYDRATERGLWSWSRFDFVVVACRAVQKANDPPAYFAKIVRDASSYAPSEGSREDRARALDLLREIDPAEASKIERDFFDDGEVR